MSFLGGGCYNINFSLIPIIGSWVVLLLWGGPNVSVITLRKFLVLHFLLPLVIIIFTVFHILTLHTNGSTLNKINNTLFSSKTFTIKLYKYIYNSIQFKLKAYYRNKNYSFLTIILYIFFVFCFYIYKLNFILIKATLSSLLFMHIFI